MHFYIVWTVVDVAERTPRAATDQQHGVLAVAARRSTGRLEAAHGIGPSFDELVHAIVVAIDGEEYVGVSMLEKDLANPTKLQTDLTGVIRSHRRRGIATALKVHALSKAKATEAEFVETDNEENNPMFDLNLQLGFVAQPAWLDFRKVLREPREGETIPEVKSGAQS